MRSAKCRAGASGSMSAATVRAPASPNATTMSTRSPAQVKSTPVTASSPPSTGRALVDATEERERCPKQDPEIDRERAVLHVPDVELDALSPRQSRTPVDLRPAGDPRPDVQAVALVFVIAVDLVAERRPRADQRHLAADDVPELRQLVDRRPPQDATDPPDPRGATVDRLVLTSRFRADNHRPQLQQLEVDAV